MLKKVKINMAIPMIEVCISRPRGSWGGGGNIKRYSEIRKVATLQKEYSKEYSKECRNKRVLENVLYNLYNLFKVKAKYTLFKQDCLLSNTPWAKARRIYRHMSPQT